MYPENRNNSNNTGWIEVITGPKFSGKTAELIRWTKRAQISNQEVKIYKQKQLNA